MLINADLVINTLTLSTFQTINDCQSFVIYKSNLNLKATLIVIKPYL
jgi:hypothetical protein